MHCFFFLFVFLRLQRNILSNVDPSNNMIYEMLMTGLADDDSVDPFADEMKKICDKQQQPSAEINLPPFFQSTFYYMTSSMCYVLLYISLLSSTSTLTLTHSIVSTLCLINYMYECSFFFSCRQALH